MKSIIIWIAFVLLAGLTVYNTLTLGRVRGHQTEAIVLQPTDEQSNYPQSPPVERLTEYSNFDYSEDLFVGNKLHIDPIVTVNHSGLHKDIGDIWNDAAGSALRYNDGNTSGGVEFTFAKFGSDVVTIKATANDTVDFPDLFGDHASVNYTVTIDTVNGTTGTLTLLDTYHADSTYVSMNSTVFPYTLTEGVINFVSATTLKYNRAIFLVGDADTVSMTITRDFELGQ